MKFYFFKVKYNIQIYILVSVLFFGCFDISNSLTLFSSGSISNSLQANSLNVNSNNGNSDNIVNNGNNNTNGSPPSFSQIIPIVDNNKDPNSSNNDNRKSYK